MDTCSMAEELHAHEPEHIASTRRVYDHSASLYVDAVGTTVTSSFERPIDRGVLSRKSGRNFGA